MRRGDDQTEPGLPPDTRPGPEPERAPLEPLDPYHPPILDPDMAALLEGHNASRGAHAIPRVIPTTDGELTAVWSAEARDVQSAYPTPEPIPNVVLTCTEETPALAAFVVASRAVDPMLIDTDPSAEDEGFIGSRRGSASLIDTAPIPRRAAAPVASARKKRTTGTLVAVVVALVATLGVAARIGRRPREHADVESAATHAAPIHSTVSAVVETPPAQVVSTPPAPVATAATVDKESPLVPPRAAATAMQTHRPPLPRPAPVASSAQGPSPTTDIYQGTRAF